MQLGKNSVLKFAIRKTQTDSKHTLKEIISLKYFEVRMLDVELYVVCFFFFSHSNCGLCFNVESIVFKLTIRNYDTPPKWVTQKRLKNEVIPKDFLSFRSGVIIIVNYKYQENILSGLLNLSLEKRKWWTFFFSYYYQVHNMKMEKDRISFYFQWKTLRKLNLMCHTELAES